MQINVLLGGLLGDLNFTFIYKYQNKLISKISFQTQFWIIWYVKRDTVDEYFYECLSQGRTKFNINSSVLFLKFRSVEE